MTTVTQWLTTAPGQWFDTNASGTADCTDVPKAMHEACTGTSWEEGGLWGHGVDLARNANPAYYTVQPFSTEVHYPPGTIFSAGVPGSLYGHTGVLTRIVDGQWWALQQDTYLDQPCWEGPLATGGQNPHAVAIPLYLDTHGSAAATPADTITQSQEDDMPLTPADLDAITNRLVTAPLSTTWGTLTLPELIMEAAEQASIRTLTRHMQTNVGEVSLADLTVGTQMRLAQITQAPTTPVDVRVTVNGREV